MFGISNGQTLRCGVNFNIMHILFQAKLKKKMHSSQKLSDMMRFWRDNPSNNLLCIHSCPILPIFLLYKTLQIYQGSKHAGNDVMKLIYLFLTLRHRETLFRRPPHRAWWKSPLRTWTSRIKMRITCQQSSNKILFAKYRKSSCFTTQS